MHRFAVLMLALAATAKNIQERSIIPINNDYSSAASESQIKFAIENKYDDTGPGAKQPQYAYKTYNNIDDAILAYVNDPDTKLPEQEKLKAFRNIQLRQQSEGLNRYYPKTVAGYTSYQSKPLPVSTKYNYADDQYYYQKPKTKINYLGFRDNSDLKAKNTEAYKHQRLQFVKGSPLSLAHYTRDHDIQHTNDQFNPFAKYTYSYGVQDRGTGDAKSAQETRDGGAVHGYYSYTDPFGKLRTVHYTADNLHGYRATVDRSHV